MIFAKAPVPGEVKTRLHSLLDPKAAAHLYEQLVVCSLETAVEAGVGPIELWCTPSAKHPFFLHCSKLFRVNLRRQIEGDIGKRMAWAFLKALKRSDAALVIGSDCPSLTSDDLRRAKEILQEGRDAVVSPTEDGGYGLLGLRRFNPQLFEKISWSTESVFQQTRERLHSLGWQWQELSTRWDVDRPEDVERLLLKGGIRQTKARGMPKSSNHERI